MFLVYPWDASPHSKSRSLSQYTLPPSSPNVITPVPILHPHFTCPPLMSILFPLPREIHAPPTPSWVLLSPSFSETVDRSMVIHYYTATCKWIHTIFLLLGCLLQPQYKGKCLVLLYLEMPCSLITMEDAPSSGEKQRRSGGWRWQNGSVGRGLKGNCS